MRRLLAGIGVAGLLGLLAASTASAVVKWPQQFGDRCAAAAAEPAVTALLLSNGVPQIELGSGVPPEGAAVITRWKVNAPAGMAATQQRLVAAKPLSPGEYVQLGESSLETVAGGAANEFTTRIPVSEGNSIGLRGPGGALVCGVQPPAGGIAHAAGYGPDAWANGEPRPVKIEEDVGVPVIATVEPDRDGDGYGDETQDECTEEPRLHTPCPAVHLIVHSKLFKRGILIEASTGDPARLEVAGHVGWTYRPPGGGPKRHLGFDVPGGTQEVAQGATVSFWLQLPRQAVERLRDLTTKDRLKVHVGFVATDALGHQSLNELTFRLPGWRKVPPAPRHSR